MLTIYQAKFHRGKFPQLLLQDFHGAADFNHSLTKATVKNSSIEIFLID